MAIATIIGAGMMGSALAFPVRENGHEVRLVSPPNSFCLAFVQKNAKSGWICKQK